MQSTRSHVLRAWPVAAGLLLIAAVSAGAEEPAKVAVHRFLASDFPQLAKGIKLPDGQSFTVKVWSPKRQEWSLSGEKSTWKLSAKQAGDDATPRWQSVGQITGRSGEDIKIEFDRAEVQPARNAATPSEPPGPATLPAIIVLASDSKFDASTALDISRGRVDTAAPADDARRTQVRTNKQGADFHAPATAQEWRDRAKAVREQLLVSLGLWPLFPKTALQPRISGTLERDGYTIEKVTLETFPGFFLSGNLYRPVGKTGKVPAVLCPHGHWEDGRVNPEVQQRCIRWAKLGAVVFLYDMVGYNDSQPFGHRFLNDRLRRWGLSLPTLQTWNSIRILDWISTLPDVDPARIGCTGESGGGTQTFLLTAIDDRIKVSAPVVMVSDTFQGGCVCENAAGLRLGTDNVEFAALTAPRPLKLVGASGDWTAKTMSNAYPAIRGVYSLFGTTDRISAEAFEFPHNYNQTTRNAVYAFMGKWLLGIDDADSTKEGTQTVEKAEDLRVFGKDGSDWPKSKTAAELEDHLIGALEDQIQALSPSQSDATWQAARNLLLTSLKVRVGLVNPTPAELASRDVRRVHREGATIVHSLVKRKAASEQIPTVRITPTHPTGCVTLIATPRGKDGLQDEQGQFSPLVKALLERGQGVVGFDPLMVGESFDPASPALRRPETVHYETYNPSLCGDQLQDLATVLAWARSQPDVREVSLVAQGAAGPQVLLARPALQGLARTVIDLDNFEPGKVTGEFPRNLDLPGMFQFGGFKAAAALASPAPLWIHGVPQSFDRAWPEMSYTRSDASQQLRLDEGTATPEAIAKWVDRGE
ncbi:alpha/beta hydrolase [Singulisphaera sp. PoT]|uniref:alpha/beta hydrolase n=1 Tax=Singulisphaera sp. PoT TaxID=3411797 RepID=UPI003BF48DAF